MRNTKAPTEFPASALWYCEDVLPPVVNDEGCRVYWTRVTVLGPVPMGERTYYRFEYNGEEVIGHPGDFDWDVPS